MAGGLAVYIWEQRNIEILVVLSFNLQVILLLFAGIRRRQGSTLLRTLLWLAYLMADYTAIYALGHMSISSRSPGHQLVPLWAPLLLLHLGGPDTITAYAFEDNQLWLRHLLTLVVQVIGAAYVLYQYIAVGTNPGTLLAAAALVFISGLLKYGERTWALKCAGMDSIASSLDNNSASYAAGPHLGREEGGRLDTEEVLLGAHYMLSVCKGLLVDRPSMDSFQRKAIAQGIQLHGNLYMYELIGMELSLMYDILYTKAAVIHSWYGLCVRIISPLSAAAAFLLFQLSSKDARHTRVDVIVTYVMLVGAVVLETASSLRAAGSSWACASLHAQGWHRLCGAVMRLRRLLKAGERRRASLGSLGQYNLLDLCTCGGDDLRGKIAKTIGLEDRWQKLHYSSTVPISDGVKVLVLKEIRTRGMEDLRNARGRWILKERGMYDDLARIVEDPELDHSILVWHVATEFYLSLCPEDEEGTDGAEVRDAIRVLSNHMLFLLVVHPYLLPGVVRSGRYKENYMYFNRLWWRSMKGSTSTKKEGSMKLDRATIVKKIAEWQLPADTRRRYVFGPDDGGDDDIDDRPAYAEGTRLAAMLLGNRWFLPVADMLQVIAGVWVEMLCYAGYHCGEENHARKLSTGGELITAVWLLMGHATLYDGFAPSAEALAGVSKPKPKAPARWRRTPPREERRGTQRPSV